MVLIASTRSGCSLSLSTRCGRRATQLGATATLAFRLDRPGFRPLHFLARPLTATHTTRPLKLVSPYACISNSRYSSRRMYATQPSPSTSASPAPLPEDPDPDEDPSELISHSPYTLPNALTIARIIACPFLGYQIVQGDYVWATGLLFACGVSDWLDGYLARHYSGKSVLGSILDPMADKTLMTTLVITLAWAGLLPVSLAVLILGRDVALSLWAMKFRYSQLPPPRTVKRYLDPSIQSAEIKPTQISKVNTALQLVLMGFTTISPLITAFPIAEPLTYLQWAVAGTTLWSGLSYVDRPGFRMLNRPMKAPKMPKLPDMPKILQKKK